MENWKPIEHFPGYSVSDHGRVRTDKSGKILALNRKPIRISTSRDDARWGTETQIRPTLGG